MDDLHATIKHKHLLPIILHHILAHPLHQVTHITLLAILIFGWEVDFVQFFVAEEKFKAATWVSLDGVSYVSIFSLGKNMQNKGNIVDLRELDH